MENKPVRKSGRFISLRFKLLAGFTILFSIIFVIVLLAALDFTGKRAITQLDASLLEALHAAADSIDGDKLVALYEEAEPNLLVDDRGDDDPANDVYFTDDPRFWDIARVLWAVHSADRNALPFTWIKLSDIQGDEPGTFAYIVPGLSLAARIEGEGLPDWIVNFKQEDVTTSGQIFQIYSSLETGGDGFVTFINDPYDWQVDENGQPIYWVSGYAPIRNADGEVVAGLGMDYRYTYVTQVQQQVRDGVIIGFAVSYVVLGALVFFLFGVITRPILKLTKIAERIGEGDYEQDLTHLSVSRMPDEINTLARVFGVMIEKVQRREEKLKERVAELQIIIDEKKLSQQVSEIVDTDFFNDLQAKARDMRHRKARDVDAITEQKAKIDEMLKKETAKVDEELKEQFKDNTDK